MTKLKKPRFKLLVYAGRIEKDQILQHINLNKVKFTNNSHPEDEYKEKHYLFESDDLEQVYNASKRLYDSSGHSITWAVLFVHENGTETLLSTDGFARYNQNDLKNL